MNVYCPLLDCSQQEKFSNFLSSLSSLIYQPTHRHAQPVTQKLFPYLDHAPIKTWVFLGIKYVSNPKIKKVKELS